MTTTIEDVFDQSIARYQAGEAPDELIPVFQEICERAPKSSPAWTCLAWLYLLEDKPKSALTAAKKAIKLNPEDAQARVNLILAMLDTDQKGVRPHVELVQHILSAVAEVREEVEKNCSDGLTRKPDWKSMQRVQDWLFT
jgi:tetratricopeptide (TPR) repeat protein